MPKFKKGDLVKIQINRDVPRYYIHTAHSEQNEGQMFRIHYIEPSEFHDYSKFYYMDVNKNLDTYEEDLVLIRKGEEGWWQRLKALFR